MKLTLIPNWRYRAPRMLSMWCYTVIAALCVGWLLSAWITDRRVCVSGLGVAWILGLSILGALLRLVAQPGLVEDLADTLSEDRGTP